MRRSSDSEGIYLQEIDGIVSRLTDLLLQIYADLCRIEQLPGTIQYIQKLLEKIVSGQFSQK